MYMYIVYPSLFIHVCLQGAGMRVENCLYEYEWVSQNYQCPGNVGTDLPKDPRQLVSDISQAVLNSLTKYKDVPNILEQECIFW